MRQTPTLGNAQNHGNNPKITKTLRRLDKSWNDGIHGPDPMSGLGQDFMSFGINDNNPTGNQWGQAEVNQTVPWDIDAVAFNGANGKSKNFGGSMEGVFWVNYIVKSFSARKRNAPMEAARIHGHEQEWSPSQRFP